MRFPPYLYESVFNKLCRDVTVISINDLDKLIISIKEEPDKLRAIYDSLHKELFAYAFSILKDCHLAEDAVSETMLRLYKLADRFKSYGKGRMYIFTICKRVSFELRKDKFQDIPVENLYDFVTIQKEEVNIDSLFLQDILSTLNVKEREVIVLHYYHEFTFKEISKILKCPEGTVKWRHTQALKKCRLIESEVHK